MSLGYRYAEDNGLTYSPDHVLATNGAKQCTTHAVLDVLSCGDEVKLSSCISQFFRINTFHSRLDNTMKIAAPSVYPVVLFVVPCS